MTAVTQQKLFLKDEKSESKNQCSIITKYLFVLKCNFIFKKDSLNFLFHLWNVCADFIKLFKWFCH